MPLLGNGEYREPFSLDAQLQGSKDPGLRCPPVRRQSQHSATARVAMNKFSSPNSDDTRVSEEGGLSKNEADHKAAKSHSLEGTLAAPSSVTRGGTSNGATLSDTPSTTASNSPTMYVNFRSLLTANLRSLLTLDFAAYPAGGTLVLLLPLVTDPRPSTSPV